MYTNRKFKKRGEWEGGGGENNDRDCEGINTDSHTDFFFFPNEQLKF